MRSLVRRPATWLVALITVHLLVNAVWIAGDSTLRAEDMGSQMAGQAHAYRVLLNEGLGGIFTVLRGAAAHQWPSAASLPLALAATLVGQSVSSLRVLQILWLALLLGATYRAGSRLRGPWVGLLAAALLSLYPAIYGTSRQYGADLPGAAMVAWVMAALLAPGCFSRVGPSLHLALAVGLGVLVRPHSLLFVLAPALFRFAAVLLRGPGRARALGLTVASGLVALAVSAPWWWGRLQAIRGQFMLHQQEVPEVGDAEAESVSLLYYLKTLPEAVSLWLLLALAAGLLGLVVTRRWRGAWQLLSGAALPWVWLLAGVAAVSMMAVQAPRYLMPVYPALALVTATALSAIDRRRVRLALLPLVLGVAALAWLACSFAPWCGQVGYRDCATPRLACGHWHLSGSGPPGHDAAYTSAQRAADTLRQRHGAGGGVLVRLYSGPGEHHPLMVVNAVLMVGLPRAVLVNRPLELYPPRPDYGHDMLGLLGGESFPVPRWPVRHCYSVRLTQRVGHGPSAPRSAELAGAKLLLRRRGETRNGPLELALYRHPRCPTPRRQQGD